MKCCHDLRQGFVDRPGQVDAVVRVDTDECVAWRSRGAMVALVSRQELDHRCELLWMLGEEGRGLDRVGAHRRSSPYSNEAKLFLERSNAISGGAGPTTCQNLRILLRF